MTAGAGETGARDAVVVGSGPNGLAAAITLARAGRSVTVVEAAETAGGGVRSAQLTLPGFIHDTCSAIHPFGRLSPVLAEMELERHGLRWIEPPYSIAHPLDDGTAVLVERDVDATAARLGDEDARAYRRQFGWLARDFASLQRDVLAPFHVPLSPPRAIALARFGWPAIQSAASLARRFRSEPARALIAGAGAHSILSLTEPISGAAALVMLGSAHAGGWPFPEGGSARLTEALVAELRAHGGEVVTGRRIERMDDLPTHRAALFDVSPGSLAAIAGDRLPAGYRGRLERFRHGPGVFKIDLALDGPIPWAAEGADRAGTVHLGGTFEEIARAEGAVAAGRVPKRPFVLLVQHTLFDGTRAPAGGHTAWAYCHVPNGSTADMTEPILAQIERFAPGFRDRVLSTARLSPTELEAYNPNYVGGDIAGGRLDIPQLFTRPSLRVLDPYATPDPAIFLCSASTPPGGGVHGIPGWYAARSALRRLESA